MFAALLASAFSLLTYLVGLFAALAAAAGGGAPFKQLYQLVEFPGALFGARSEGRLSVALITWGALAFFLAFAIIFNRVRYRESERASESDAQP